jgi:hypothetical protein
LASMLHHMRSHLLRLRYVWYDMPVRYVPKPPVKATPLMLRMKVCRCHRQCHKRITHSRHEIGACVKVL